MFDEPSYFPGKKFEALPYLGDDLPARSTCFPGKKFEALPCLDGDLPIRSTYVPAPCVVRDSLTAEVCARIAAGETSFRINRDYTSADGAKISRSFRFRGSK